MPIGGLITIAQRDSAGRAPVAGSLRGGPIAARDNARCALDG